MGQVRDALVLLASGALVLAALSTGPRRDGGALLDEGSRAATPLPSPLPRGAEPERIPLPDAEVDPGCAFADRGFGAYGEWHPLPLGKVLIPPVGAIGVGGEMDVLVHFHGAEPVRRELAPLSLGLVIAAVDAGTRSSDYARVMRDQAWETLLDAIRRAVADVTGVEDVRARRVAVSSWSAGSGAVSQIVAREEARRGLDALILLDSLYAGYAPGRTDLVPGQLASFVAMAQAAARGGPIFYLTHTAVPTNGYASTEQTASFLLEQLGASAISVAPIEGAPAPLVRMYDGGSLFIRGYGGGTRDDHCAQIRLLPGILAEHVLPAFEQGG